MEPENGEFEIRSVLLLYTPFCKAQGVLGTRHMLLLFKNFRGSNLFPEIGGAKQMASVINCTPMFKV